MTDSQNEAQERQQQGLFALGIAGNAVSVSDMQHSAHIGRSSNSTLARSDSFSPPNRSHLASLALDVTLRSPEVSAERITSSGSGLAPAVALAASGFDAMGETHALPKTRREQQSRGQVGAIDAKTNTAAIQLPEPQACVGDGLGCHLDGCFCGFLEQCRIYEPDGGPRNIVSSRCQFSLVSISALACFVVIVAFFVGGTCAAIVIGKPSVRRYNNIPRGRSSEPEGEPEGIIEGGDALEPEGEPKHELYDRVILMRYPRNK